MNNVVVRSGLRLLLYLSVMTLLCGQASAVHVITVDPNAASTPTPGNTAAPTDARLAQKVSYEGGYVSVRQVLEDLSAATGIELYAGVNRNDWRVRSRKMNIFVKDVRMVDLMNSIAYVMKFNWDCNNDHNPPTYRLVIDTKAAAHADAEMKRANKRKEDLWQTRRNEWMDACREYGTKSPAELESLRETSPLIYRYTRYGAVQALDALLDEVPEIRERFTKGQSFRISSSQLSPDTRSLVYEAGNNYWKYLQMSGQCGEQTDNPPGYTDLGVDDKYDVAFIRMDEVGGFTPGMRWGGPGTSAGYLHLVVNGYDREVFDMRAINEERSKLSCDFNNMFLDGINEFSGDLSARREKIEADEKKMEEYLYPSEPRKEHTDFPELDKEVKLELDAPKADQSPALVTNSYIASFQKALAEATGMGVVSDSWVDIEGDEVPDKEMALSELLDGFSRNYNYNWEKRSHILEFQHRKWWKHRLNQIPDEWVAKWSENTRENGVLSLDDLARISELDYYQVEESLTPDKVLGVTGVYKQILSILDRNIHWLHLYSSLSSKQRGYLRDRWISGAMLSPDQWDQAQTIFDRVGSLRSDALFSLTLMPDGRYEFREFEVSNIRNNDIKEDRRWVVTLPRYLSPKKPK